MDNILSYDKEIDFGGGAIYLDSPFLLYFEDSLIQVKL